MGVYRQPGSSNWSIDYSDARGRRIRKVIGPDKDEAQEAYEIVAGIERQKRRGLLPKVDNDVPLSDVRKAYLDFMERNRRSATAKLAKYAVDTALSLLSCATVSDVRLVDAERARTELLKDHSERTVSIVLAGLKRMLTWAVKQGMIAENPLKNLGGFVNAPSQNRRALNRDEVKTLLEASAQYRPLWFTLLCTGLRKSELVQLRWRDLDLEGGKLYVRPEVAKTKKARSVPMPSELTDMLSDTHRKRNPEPDDHVFLNKAGRPWRNNLLKRLKASVRKAGIDPRGVDLHGMRYSYGTLLYHNGVDLKTLQGLLGHASFKLTMDTYVKVDRQVSAKAVERLPFLERGSFTSYKAEAERKSESG